MWLHVVYLLEEKSASLFEFVFCASKIILVSGLRKKFIKTAIPLAPEFVSGDEAISLSKLTSR